MNLQQWSTKVMNHEADHRDRLADTEQAECQACMAKGDGDRAAYHSKQAATFRKSAAFYRAHAEVAKASEIADLAKSDHATSVIPSNVPASAFAENRAVPRTGAPELVNKADVPLQFQHLVEVSDEV